MQGVYLSRTMHTSARSGKIRYQYCRQQNFAEISSLAGWQVHRKYVSRTRQSLNIARTNILTYYHSIQMAARRRGNWGRGSGENYAYLGLHHSLVLRRQSQYDTRAKAPRGWPALGQIQNEVLWKSWHVVLVIICIRLQHLWHRMWWNTPEFYAGNSSLITLAVRSSLELRRH